MAKALSNPPPVAMFSKTPSPSPAAVLAASSATATDAQSTAAIQKVDLIIPSMQTSKAKLREPTGETDRCERRQAGRSLRGVYGQRPRRLQAPQLPKEPW